MEPEGLSVGELATATGLTVRTLHHYDHLGLVCPSEKTADLKPMIVDIHLVLNEVDVHNDKTVGAR